MTAVIGIVVLALMMFVFMALLMRVLSSETFVRAFDWTIDHPVITGLTFCTFLATLFVVAASNN